MILGIDPGPEQSGFALIHPDHSIEEAGKVDNAELYPIIRSMPNGDPVVIETIQSYGMAVGRSTFETCIWIGCFKREAEKVGNPVSLYGRPQVFRYITGQSKGGDSALRAALLRRFGGDRKGEPLNVLKGSTDKRSAFAVAVYHADGAALGEW